MTKDCGKLVASYLAWLKAKITVREINGVCEITTPFLDRHNDRLQIYVQEKDGRMLLSDDGYIIGDLESCGCGLDSPHRRELLATILNGFGVKNDDDILVIEAGEEDFPRKKHALLQAMMTVNDMFMTAQSRVVSLFLEDVARFLEFNEVRFSPSVEFTGKSGFVHRFDFLIPKSRKKPERIMRALNNPTKDNATTLLFAWNDTREVRPGDAEIYAILNDAERSPSADVLGALHQYDVKTVLWSERDNYVSEFTA